MNFKHRLKSFGKINLFLDVESKRSDGFHNIRTIFQEISLYDSITINRMVDKNTVKTNIPELDGNNNIVYKLLESMQKFTGIKGSSKIKIKKRLPVSGGLGGGSSNAAVVYKFIKEKLGIEMGEREETDFLLSLGSDIYFFLKGGVSIGTVRGEKVNPVVTDLIFDILLVNPGIKISTEESYESLKTSDFRNGRARFNRVVSGLENNDLEMVVNNLYNIFEERTFVKYPVLKEISEALKFYGAAGSLMSGTGSTVFGLFRRASEARKCFSILKKKFDFVHLAKSKRNSSALCK